MTAPEKKSPIPLVFGVGGMIAMGAGILLYSVIAVLIGAGLMIIGLIPILKKGTRP